ncbi:uncharacterized protein LOC131545184 isoform X2 [Onychostoma macrolepis]|uniref:uncharacterized protein LOC131545184 isoform X2 n=1 Tax=Onychostoma macrolepis TaxID=369639 RepID=UPI00272C17A9|nr:uncharacterized protein LOC131545184 isoform X2 [Onychostoma macrolepis]
MSCQVMTRPKFRPCPSCQTPNQASRKSCYVCFGSLSTKQKINDKVVSLDSQWGQSVKKSRNVGRIIDSARIAVRKLEAVGYKPILFIGKQNKKASNKWVADIITHLHPTPVTRNVLEKMRRAYEFILTKAQQLDSDIPTAEQHNSPRQEQCSGSILEPESLTEDLPESLTVEQPESLTVEQPESLTVEQPENLTKESETSSPPPLPCSKSLQQRKERTKTSICSPAPSATSVSPPSLIPTDLSLPQSCPPPAASSISQSLSQEGPSVKKKRKGCRKCSRQKIFLFDKITGERINEASSIEVSVIDVCGKRKADVAKLGMTHGSLPASSSIFCQCLQIPAIFHHDSLLTLNAWTRQAHFCLLFFIKLFAQCIHSFSIFLKKLSF